MSRQINVQETFTAVPSGYDSNNSSYYSVSSSYPISNGYDTTSSSDFAYITCNTGSRATTYISYTFDTSAIPQEATIDSVACEARVRVSSTSYISTAHVQLYKGGTAKGSSTSARTTTATTYNLSTGSWTRDELDDIEIRYTGTRGTSNTSRAAYLYFYGADLTIEYSIHGTAYTIGITSNVDSIEVEPSTQEIMNGGSASVKVYTNTLDDYVVTDNDEDVTQDLVRHEMPKGGTVSKVPSSYTTSGSINGTRYEDTVGHGVDNPSSRTGSDYCNSGSEAIIYYHFDFSDIPDDATITSMTVQAYGHMESSSQSSEIAELNVYHGTTAKGTTEEYTSTSSHLVTINAGSWTVAELKDDARVGFTIGYYGGLTTGITWTVTYSMPSTGSDYYWEYTLDNITADHVIVVDNAGAIIPPEEDPNYNYYPVTISSINATTNPHNGTTRVQEGTSETITISPTDPKLTLALDNGVDITSLLVGGVPTNNYTVTEQVSGASYGFELNSSTGYYVSTNKGISKTASVARLNMDFESDCLVTITYINYAEEDYDYGMFGKLDTEVATDGLTASQSGSSPSDSISNYELARCSNSSSPQTITYQVPSGEHFIDIKYGKDDASDANNDSLQWKVTSVEATSAGGDYTYTLSNINQKHSLVFIFGDVEYYFINSSTTDKVKLYPDGQTVKLKGQSYQIRIIPNDPSAKVTMTDNNTDVTNSLVREETTDEKSGLIVNYTYKLTNVSAEHNLVIKASSGGIFIKVSGTWTKYSKVYLKADGRWQEAKMEDIMSTSANYVKG